MKRKARRWSQRAAVAAALAFLLLSQVAGAGKKKGEDVPVSGELLLLCSDLRVAVHDGQEVELEVLPSADDDYGSIARRVTGHEADADAIAAWNDRPSAEAGRWVRVPLALLSDEFRALALRRLFPQDHYDGKAWVHLARSGVLPTYDEGLWEVAEWFTGDGNRFVELMRANRLSSPELRGDQQIRVPATLLASAFRPRLKSEDGALEYSSDEQGPYAAYRLLPGEALYSAVVVRFTGRTGAEDVKTVATELARRNNIPDLRDIPASLEIKVPLDLLEPQYLPKGHPRRVEAEARDAEMARVLQHQPVAGTRGGLEGVMVILDPGHGGRDLGTMNNGLWEHDYVYDVTCRLRHKLDSRTQALTVMTLVDKETGCEPSRADKLVANREGTILTDPPFLAMQDGEAKIGVNLRWYLANSVYREATKKGADPDRVVFLSLHADARHASLRGVMVYVPGEAYRTGTYGHTSGAYRKYREVSEKPRVHYSRKERVRSEAISRKFADSVVDAFRAEDLPVQPYQPVRDKVIRGKSRWVPAVLRGNAVPTKVLIEMVNLSNPADAKLLGRADDRDRLAEAIFLALHDHFGEDRRQIASTGAASGRASAPAD